MLTTLNEDCNHYNHKVYIPQPASQICDDFQATDKHIFYGTWKLDIFYSTNFYHDHDHVTFARAGQAYIRDPILF